MLPEHMGSPDPTVGPNSITETGALCISSGSKAGRVPKQKRIVEDDITRDVSILAGVLFLSIDFSGSFFFPLSLCPNAIRQDLKEIRKSKDQKAALNYESVEESWSIYRLYESSEQKS